MKRKIIIQALLILSLFSVNLFAQDSLFSEPVSYAVGDGPTSVFFSDLDNDGDFDLIIGYAYTNGVSVLINNGNRTFQTPVNYPTGEYSNSVFAADISNDGDNDIAVANFGSDIVAILFNNGDGTFEPAVNYLTGDGPHSIFIADFDKDSDSDLVVVNVYSKNFSILLNNGDGSFLLDSNYTINDPRTLGTVVSNYINGDSNLDLAISIRYSNKILILFGNGDGTFQEAVEYSCGYDPVRIFSVDFNNDEYIDLVTANLGGNSITVLLNDGTGTFLNRIDYESLGKPHGLFSTDINSDDYYDIAVSNRYGNNISIFLNQGDGTFENAEYYDAGSDPTRLSSADFDGDGSPDLVVTNVTVDSISILYQPRTWYVSVDGDDINGDGSELNPLGTIQHAIDLTIDGDTVLVADGIYTGDGNTEIIFGGKAIKLISENGPESSIIDCNGTPEYPKRGFYFHLSYETNNSIIEGFTIRDGYGGQYGGAIWLYYSSPTIRNCIFVSDSAVYGGAIWGEGSSPKIINCVFDSNLAHHGGAAFFRENSNPIIENSLFYNNIAEDDGGAILCYGNSGTGIGSINLNHCLFLNNNAVVGGAIKLTYLSEDSTTNIENSTFSKNSATYLELNLGACISMESLSPTISNCLFSQNNHGAALYMNNGYPELLCTDIWDNVGGDWTPDIIDQLGINGNINLDPLFCNTVSGDFHINSASPCAPDNNECSALIGFYDIGCGAEILSLEFENEELMNIVSHTPKIIWEYYDYGEIPQDSFDIDLGSDNDWSIAELWDPGTFFSSDTFITYAGSPLYDGYTYYIRIRVHNSFLWSPWYETVFRMNTKPTIPILLRPINDTIINTDYSLLWIQNSTDTEDDSVVYDFVYCYDTSYGEPDPVWDYNQPGGIDSTSWTIPWLLNENWRYFWNSRAFDGYEYSDWAMPGFFWFNAIEETPAEFKAQYPPDTGYSYVHNMLETFWWEPSVDPDPLDSVYYKLHISIDSNFTYVNIVDSIWTTEYALTDSLEFATQYWWKVEAVDNTGLTTETWNKPDFKTWMLGDADGNYAVNILDITFLINYLYKGGQAPIPEMFGDVNGDCTVNILDITYLIAYLYKGGQAPQIGCE